MFERSVVEQVRARIDLAELVGQYVPLRRAGASWVARCPFHDERTPSFSVNPDRGLYHCFGCKASGDALRFYEQMEGVTFVEALRALAEKSGVEIAETRDPARIAEDRRQRDLTERLIAVNETAAAWFERCLREDQDASIAREALAERGITDETTERFRLGYAPARWSGLVDHLKSLKLSPADAETAGLINPGKTGGWYDRFRHRLMFPVFDRMGRVVAFSGRILPVPEAIPEGVVPEDSGKYVNSPETPVYRKSEALYGLAQAKMSMRQNAEAILVEGNFDVVQMHQHGFTATAAPLGTSFTDSQARLLRRFAETVVLVFDADPAGTKAAESAHVICANAGLVARVGVLPEGQDPDTFLRDPSGGPEAMRGRIDNGLGIAEWLIDDARKIKGDSMPAQMAKLRMVIPIIAQTRLEYEREALIKRAVPAFVLDEQTVRVALRDHLKGSPVNAPVRAPSSSADDLLRRMALAAKDLETSDVKSTRTTSAVALEALLVCPALLESPEAESLGDLLEEVPAVIFHAMRAQWAAVQRIDGAVLLELVKDQPKQQQWIAARLAVSADETELLNRCRESLTGAATALRRARANEYARFLKHQSARAGVQGDPATENALLNEQLMVKRQIAMGDGPKGRS